MYHACYTSTIIVESITNSATRAADKAVMVVVAEVAVGDNQVSHIIRLHINRSHLLKSDLQYACMQGTPNLISTITESETL